MTPLTPAFDRSTAARRAGTEFTRCTELFSSLQDADWAAPTECPDWDVRQMAAHMLGMVEMVASIRETIRQQRAATIDGALEVDALTALQVRERADWTGERIAQRFAERWPAAVRGRRRTPWFVRRRTIPQRVNGSTERWTLAYLLDVILTRDPWTHRMDICRALGREPVLTAEHDGAIVADVVAEWSARHGKEFSLTLTGPAGGSWQVGEDGPVIEMDAIEFCRVLSGRVGAVPLERLLSTEVPF
jgi:uncharacterized protein (TIGR03083 family)